MRIAFIGGFAFSPKGTIRARAHPLAGQLVRCGHQVTIFLPPYDNIADSMREWVEDGVRIVNVSVSASLLSYPCALRALIHAITKYEPDVVHVFKPKGFAGAVGTYCLLRRTMPIVLDCDDWEGWGGWNDIKHYPWIVKECIDRQERWLMGSVPAITVVSRSLQQRAFEMRSQKSSIFYVPNCASFEENHERHRLAAQALSPEESRRSFNLPHYPLILYSGHFDTHEDVDLFCKAAIPVAKRNRAALVIVGHGPGLAKIRAKLLTSAHVQSYFFPQLPYPEFLKLVWASDVTAYPYPDDLLHRSKCSARIIDYMAMGKPVVTSAVGQNAEYVVDGESGLLTSPGDEKDFGEKLELLLHSPELRHKLGQNAARRIRDKFNWRGSALQECLAAYEYALQ